MHESLSDAESCYIYNARLIEVINGDLVDLKVDLGFNMHSLQRIKVAGVDAGGIHTSDPGSSEHEAAKEHIAVTREYLGAGEAREVQNGFPLLVQVFERGSQEGRWVGDILSPEVDRTLSQILRSEFDNLSVEDSDYDY